MSDYKEKKAITSFVQEKATGQNTVSPNQGVRDLKDEDLMSGRHSNNLQPVIFSSPENEEGGRIKLDFDTQTSQQNIDKLVQSSYISKNTMNEPSNLVKNSNSELGGHSGSYMELNFQAKFNGELSHEPGSALISRADNHTRQGMRDPTIATNAQIVPRSMVPMKKREPSHKELMEQIERSGALSKQSRQKSLSRDPSRVGTASINQSREQYRSPSAFMAQAEMAAEAYAKLGDQEVVNLIAIGSSTGLLDRANSQRSTLQAASPNTGSPVRLNLAETKHTRGLTSHNPLANIPKDSSLTGRSSHGTFGAKTHTRNSQAPPAKPTRKRMQQRSIHGTDILQMSQTQQNLNKLRMSKVSTSKLQMLGQVNSGLLNSSNFGLGIEGSNISRPQNQKFFQIKSQSSLKRYKHYINPQQEVSSETKDYSHKTGDILSANIKNIESTANKSSNINRDLEGVKRQMSGDKNKRSQQGQIASRNQVGYQSHQNFRYSRGRIAHTSEQRFRSNKNNRTQKTTHVVSQETFHNSTSNQQAQDYIYTSNNFLSKPLSIQNAEPATSLIIQSAESQDRSSPPDFIRITNNNGNQNNNMSPKSNTHIILKAHGGVMKNNAGRQKNSDLSLNDTDGMQQSHDFRVQGKNVQELQDTVITSQVDQVTPKNLEIETNRDLFYMQREGQKPEGRNIQGSPLHKLNQDLKKVQPRKDRQIEKLKSLVQSSCKTTPGTQNLTDENMAPVAAIQIGSHRLKETSPEEQKAKFHNDRLKNPNISFQKDIVGSFERYEMREERNTRMGQPIEKKVVQQRQYLPIQKLQLMNIQTNGQMVNDPSVAVQADLSSTQNALSSCTASFRFLSQRQRKKELKLNFDQFQPRIIAKPNHSRSPNNRTPSRQQNVPDATTYQELSQMQAPETDPLVDTTPTHSQPSQFGGKESKYLANQKQIQAKKQALYGTQFTQNAIQKENLKRSQQTTQNLSPDLIAIDDDLVVNKVDMNLNVNTFSNTSYIRRSISVNQGQGDSSSSQMKAINKSPKPTTIILKKNQSKERHQSVKTVLHVKNGFAKVESQDNDDGPDSEIHHMQIVESKIDLPQMQKVNISRQYRVVPGPTGNTQKIEFHDSPFTHIEGRNDSGKVVQEHTFTSKIDGNKSLIGIKQTNISQPNLHDSKRRSKSGLDRASVETKTAENGPTTLHSQEGAQSKMTTKILETATQNGSMAKLKPIAAAAYSNIQPISPQDKVSKEGDSKLKSVHENEEIALLQRTKSEKEQAEHRRKSREQFHERQKDMADRKKSKVPKSKNKIMVNPHLMSSPMQTLGKVSLINKRQEAIMNERTQEDRDQYLTEMISLRDDPEQDKRDKEVAAALSFRSPPGTERSVRAHHKEQLARSQVSRGGKARDYEKMDVSPTILNKLHRQLQYRKNLSQAIKNNQPVDDPALMDVDSQISQPDVFKPELIQTAADEVVFSRINPHLLQQRTAVNIKDQSLYKLLEKNGGVPMSPKEIEKNGKKKSDGKKGGKQKKPYHEMNDFQKQTYDFILRCRREIKAETIQATLTQYIKENKDEEKLNEFCQELIATQKAKKDKLEQKLKKAGQEMTAAERARERRNQKKSSLNNCPNSEVLSFTSEPQCPGSKISPQKRALYEKQPTKELNMQIVELYDQEKLIEKAQKLQKEEDDQQFSGMSKQKKDTRFSLTKQERERILEKLDNIWKLELKQEEARQEFKIAYEKARLEKFRKYDIDYYFKMKEQKKLEAIKQRIENHKNKVSKQDQEEESTQVEEESPPIWKVNQDVAYDEAVVLSQPEIDFENLRNKEKKQKIKGDPKGIINQFSQNDFTEEDELAYTEAMRQEYALGLTFENMSDDSLVMEVDNDFEDDLAFFKEFWINYRHKQDKLDRKLGKTPLFKWAPNTPRDNKARRPGMSTGSRMSESPASKNRSNASPTTAMRGLKQISERDTDEKESKKDESSLQQSPSPAKKDEIVVKVEQVSSSDDSVVIHDESIQLEVNKIKQKEQEASSAFITEIGKTKDYFKMRNSTSVLPPVNNHDLKESLLEKKYKAVPNNKLRQTQIANQRHMQNIQNNRHSSVGKWGVRKANNMMVETQKNFRDNKLAASAKSFVNRNGIQSTKNLSTNNGMRQSLLNLARDCHNELLDPTYDQLRELKKAVILTQPSKRPQIQKKKVNKPKQAKVTAPVAAQENKAFRKYDEKIEGIRAKQQDFLKNLDKFYENREKVRFYEAEDDYQDILIENIKQEQAYIEEDEAQVAESVRNEMIEQRDLKKKLRQMYVSAMKEMM